MVLLVGTLGTQTISGSDASAGCLYVLVQVVFASVPFTFLFGLLRTRVARADAIGELLLRLGEEPRADGLRCLLADALGDETLQLVFWSDSRWVKRDGSPASLPERATAGAPGPPWTWRAARVGALVHDASLIAEPDVLQAVAAAAGLAMQNEQLQATLRARLDDLRRSRARIVEAGLAERRRLERNLHDGAQQRLVALSLSLRIAQKQIGKAPERAEAMVAEAQQELTGRSRSCASWPAASIRPCCRTAGCRPPSRRSPCAPRCPCASSRCRASGCPSPWRPRPTSSSPRR